MEGGIEEGDLRQVGPQLEDGSNRREAARLVQRREGCQLLQRLHHLAGQPDRRGEVSPAMHYPVTDRDQGVRVEFPSTQSSDSSSIP